MIDPYRPAPALLLEFEREHEHDRGGRKDLAVTEHFGWPITTYYQRLSSVLDNPTTAAWDPEYVDHINDVRTRRAHRAARRPRLASTRTLAPTPGPVTVVDFLAAHHLHGLTYTHRTHSPVVHLYDGPLTTTRRRTSRGRRAVCGTPTKPMHAIDEPTLLVDIAQGTRRPCCRCSTRVAAMTRVEHLTRATTRTHLGPVTSWVLAMWVWLSASVAEAQRVSGLGAALFGAEHCLTAPVIAPTGRRLPSLAAWTRDVVYDRDPQLRETHAARRDLEEARQVALAAAAKELQKADREAAWQERQDAIAAFGIQAVSPDPRRRPRRTA